MWAEVAIVFVNDFRYLNAVEQHRIAGSAFFRYRLVGEVRDWSAGRQIAAPATKRIAFGYAQSGGQHDQEQPSWPRWPASAALALCPGRTS